MPGRIQVDDVAPVVSCGTYPAKAVVGEMVPVRATVWREGHDAVAATLVVRYLGLVYPQPGQLPVPSSRVTPQQFPMSPGRTPDLFHGQFVPDRVGLWAFRVDGWGDPLTTWRHAVRAKLDAGQGEEDLNNDLLVGSGLTSPSMAIGSRPIRAHCCGSMLSKRSWVAQSQDHRRLVDSRSSADSRSGR